MTTKIFKPIGYIVIASIFSIALSGCTRRDDTIDPNANKVVIWSFESEDSWKPVIKDFAKANKGYELIYEKQEFDSNYENRVLNSQMAGEGPDVWAMPNDWVYRHKEKLAPMPDTMLKTYNPNSYVDILGQSTIFDGKAYSLSPSAEPLLVYYNHKLIQKTADTLTDNSKDRDFNKKVSTLADSIPKTWTDFTELVKLMTIKDGANIIQSGAAIGTSSLSYSNDLLYLLMLQNETDIVTSDFRSAPFNLPKDTSTGAKDIPGKRALDFYTSFASTASPNYSWNNGLGNELEAFASGKVAIIFGYSSLQNTILQKYPDFSYKKAFVPQVSNDSTNIIDYGKFNTFGVNKLSKHPDLGWAAINSLVTNVSDEYNSSIRLYTSKKASNYDISILNREGSNPEKLELATAKTLVKGRFPLEFDIQIKNMINNINSGIQSSQSALDLTANSINELLRKTSF